jgi:hypothetical protein
MSKRNFHRLFLVAATVLTSTAAFGQFEVQTRARQQPGWDVRAREGRCEIRVWVDNRAEVRMRGDSIFVRTVEGSKGRDEGSSCSQPIPFNSVRGFQIRQTAGRNKVTLAQEPSRMNNYTAMVAIEDSQGGGDNYAFEVTWQAETDVAAAPAPFFDDVRACQDTVRARFQSQNGRGSYIDFNSFADRLSQGRNRDQGQYQGQAPGEGRDSERYPGGNRGQESIRGHGSARSFNESRDLTYSCVVDTRQNQVLSGTYQYTAAGLRTNDRRQLR